MGLAHISEELVVLAPVFVREMDYFHRLLASKYPENSEFGNLPFTGFLYLKKFYLFYSK